MNRHFWPLGWHTKPKPISAKKIVDSYPNVNKPVVFNTVGEVLKILLKLPVPDGFFPYFFYQGDIYIKSTVKYLELLRSASATQRQFQLYIQFGQDTEEDPSVENQLLKLYVRQEWHGRFYSLGQCYISFLKEYEGDDHFKISAKINLKSEIGKQVMVQKRKMKYNNEKMVQRSKPVKSSKDNDIIDNQSLIVNTKRMKTFEAYNMNLFQKLVPKYDPKLESVQADPTDQETEENLVWNENDEDQNVDIQYIQETATEAAKRLLFSFQQNQSERLFEKLPGNEKAKVLKSISNKTTTNTNNSNDDDHQ